MSEQGHSFEVIPGRPAWWSRQYIEPFTLDEDELWRIVRETSFATISWVTRTCEPVSARMAYLWYDDHIWVTSTPNRHKFQAWRRNPAICICIIDEADVQKQVVVRGKVELTNEPAKVHQFVDTLLQRRNFTGEEYDRQYAMFNSPARYVAKVNITRIRTYNGRKMYAAEQAGADVWGPDWDFPQGR